MRGLAAARPAGFFLYGATIFLSSFLLFLVQPLIARLILPWFGGGAAVWTTCMLFFQTMLLAGYAYAHALARAHPRVQALVHSALLAAAVATLPITPGEQWKPQGEENPVVHILGLLAAAVGLPYGLLAATSPLLQAWFARARPGENPYRLFAVSNLASLAALLGYPFAVEPALGGAAQIQAWSALFVAFALACAALAWLSPERGPAVGALAPVRASPVRRGRWGLWIALSATGSTLLLAVTNHLTQNVASVPLLWVVPLAIYLFTFILAFEGRGAYRPRIAWSFVLVWLAGMLWLLVDTRHQFDLYLQLAIYLSGLFFACLFCHGELYETRPPAERLTGFYLAVAAGGALGGFAVAVLAPLVFPGYFELGVALVALATLAALRFAHLHAAARAASLVLVVAAAGAALYDALRYGEDVRASARNFYGVLRVKEYGADGEPGHLRRLVHGVIMHGEQYLHPDLRRRPTTYYDEKSGVAAALASRGDGPRRVGVVGLGVGTLAAYGRPGDVFRFYEINPQVVAFAQRAFTYLADSVARIEIVPGDARLALEREPPQGYDVLVIDAFSSDAIPVHLLTREALALYLRHVRSDGIVALHVSNRFLDLVPVVARLADDAGATTKVVYRRAESDEDTQSDWVLVARSAAALAREAIVAAGAEEPRREPRWRPWSDDFSNLVQILK